MLRSHDGQVSEAPAFLQAPPAAEDGEVRRPRVRGRRPRVAAGEDVADNGASETDPSEQA